MKKFLEELAKHPEAHTTEALETEIVKIRQKMIKKYKHHIGERALLTCKHTKEKRVVTIVGMYSDYMLLSYNYYGPDYTGSCKTTISYRSIYCGDDRLEVVQ